MASRSTSTDTLSQDPLSRSTLSICLYIYIQQAPFWCLPARHGVYRAVSGILSCRFSGLATWQDAASVQPCTGASQIVTLATEYKVKEKEPGHFYGLLVQKRFAVRFTEGQAEERKTIELRTRRVLFLKPGERVMLLSTPGNASKHKRGGFQRKALGILAYKACTPMPQSALASSYSLHRCTEEELQDAGFYGDKDMYAWHFDLVYAFPEPIPFNYNGSEVWCVFSLSHFEHEQSRESPEPLPQIPRPEDNERYHWCIFLQRDEWVALASGVVESILRPFKTHEHDLLVLVKEDYGHLTVGRIHVEFALQLSDWNSVNSDLKTLYKGLSRNQTKRCYEWRLDQIDVFETAQYLRFLDFQPKYRNRTFRLSERTLTEESLVPKSIGDRLHLGETARFFIERLDRESLELLKKTVSDVGRGNSPEIRLGSTCSGTDICMTVWKETVKVFNSLEVQLRMHDDQSESDYIYIYVAG